MKKMYKTTALAMGMFCMLGAVNSFAGEAIGVDDVKQQVQELIRQNKELTARVVELESVQQDDSGVVSSSVTKRNNTFPEAKRKGGYSTMQKEIAKQLAEQGVGKVSDHITMAGLIEAEFAAGDDFDGNNFNEFNLATVELMVTGHVNEWVTGTILALYEGGEENEHLLIDEGFVEVGNFDQFPVAVAAGKIYVPFGSYDTNMIQDPMTLELGETVDYSMVVGFESNGFRAAVYGYNGMKETGGSDVIKGYGVGLKYAYESDILTLDTGISWINNIGDSGGISGYFEDNELDSIRDQVGGVSVHAVAGFGPVTVIAEWTQALDEFAEIAFADGQAAPKAWNVEIAYGADLGGYSSNFAVGMQGSSESVELGLPETRFIAAASIEIFPATALSFEYFYDNDYSVSDGGIDENANTFTTQLAYEF